LDGGESKSTGLGMKGKRVWVKQVYPPWVWGGIGQRGEEARKNPLDHKKKKKTKNKNFRQYECEKTARKSFAAIARAARSLSDREKGHRSGSRG